MDHSSSGLLHSRKHHGQEGDEDEKLLDAVFAVELPYGRILHVNDFAITLPQSHSIDEERHVVDSKSEDVSPE